MNYLETTKSGEGRPGPSPSPRGVSVVPKRVDHGGQWRLHQQLQPLVEIFNQEEKQRSHRGSTASCSARGGGSHRALRGSD